MLQSDNNNDVQIMELSTAAASLSICRSGNFAIIIIPLQHCRDSSILIKSNDAQMAIRIKIL